MWKAKLNDGTSITEQEAIDKNISWSAIKKNVSSLGFEYHGIEFELPDGKEIYINRKTASAPLASGPVCIESRYIGYEEGGKEYRIRFFEREKKVVFETE